jgi:hypothetical protein
LQPSASRSPGARFGLQTIRFLGHVAPTSGDHLLPVVGQNLSGGGGTVPVLGEDLNSVDDRAPHSGLAAAGKLGPESAGPTALRSRPGWGSHKEGRWITPKRVAFEEAGMDGGHEGQDVEEAEPQQGCQNHSASELERGSPREEIWASHRFKRPWPAGPGSCRVSPLKPHRRSARWRPPRPTDTKNSPRGRWSP